MLDVNVYGKTERMSAEAPVPVFSENTSTYLLGGAANVAQNCKALGLEVDVCGSIGIDRAGKKIKELIVKSGIGDFTFASDQLMTTVKRRYWVNNYQIFRADSDYYSQIDFPKNDINIDKYDIILLSDYNKGMSRNFKHLIKIANKRKIPTIIDPKIADLTRYRGCTWLKPNLSEWAAILDYENFQVESNTAYEKLAEKYSIGNILVTKGKDGCTIYSGKRIVELPTVAKQVFDVTGAGDTVAATLALGILEKKKSTELAQQCMMAAGIAVAYKGTYAVTKEELATEANSNKKKKDKYIPFNMIESAVKTLKSSNRKIVFTNGCFDLLHAGHIDYLSKCSELGDYMVVGLNNDSSVKKLKGTGRPINNLITRIENLSYLNFIDAIVDFSDETPVRIIDLIKPDILVKGGDYKVQNIAGADIVKRYGGTVTTIPIKYNVSTTNLLAIHERK